MNTLSGPMVPNPRRSCYTVTASRGVVAGYAYPDFAAKCACERVRGCQNLYREYLPTGHMFGRFI